MRQLIFTTRGAETARMLADLLAGVFGIEAEANALVERCVVAHCSVDSAHTVYMFAQGYLIGVEQA